jgi:long-subunit acyl-CoA synthetase (AMP-forming)
VQSMETIADNIREVQPTILFAVPTLYKRVYDKMTAKVRPGVHRPCALHMSPSRIEHTGSSSRVVRLSHPCLLCMLCADR